MTESIMNLKIEAFSSKLVVWFFVFRPNFEIWMLASDDESSRNCHGIENSQSNFTIDLLKPCTIFTETVFVSNFDSRNPNI